MSFDKKLLDEIRARVKASEVVGRKFSLKKQGSEYVVADNKSFTVSDQKGIWKDFAQDGKAGDIFEFLVEHEGYSFVDAVKELAQVAGVPLDDAPRAARQQAHGRNEIVKTWDIVDERGAILYQVVRRQKKLPDGSWELNKDGKPWKTFSQRRPSPDGDGSWIWRLDLEDEHGKPHEFMRYRGEWIAFNEKNFVDWKLSERRSFPGVGNIRHWLYNANEVADELRQPRDEQRTIFLPEGEGKVDVLTEWGLLACCNTGGAKNFTPALAEFFRGAADVVLLLDNDKAGVERLAKVAPMLRAVDAGVRALNFRDVWPECPPKGDVKDWAAAGGTRDQLLEAIDAVKPWTPEPYRSRFGAKTWADLGAPPRPYPWRIKGILPRNDNTLLMGPSRSGKTFEMLDMVMAIHFGEPYAGRKVEPGGVVYLTYEGASGFENRLRAYLIHHGLRPEDLHSFAWLTRPPGLYATEDGARDVGEEIRQLASSFKLPLAGNVVDTHNAATRGSSEIKSEDLNRIMENYAKVSEITGVPLWIIGHTNAEGRHRGNEQFFNGIEASLLVERVFTDAKHAVPKRDDLGRQVRRVKVAKNRDGDDELQWEFVLEKVKIGVDEDGDDIMSMVSVEPARRVPEDVADEASGKKQYPEGYYLKGHDVAIFKALISVMERVGAFPPPELGLGSRVSRVVTYAELGVEYRRKVPIEEDESPQQYSNKIKSRLRRFVDLQERGVIGVESMADPKFDPDTAEKPKRIHFVWPTGRRVYGKGLAWPPLPKPKKVDEPIIDQATGKPIGSIDDIVF